MKVEVQGSCSTPESGSGGRGWRLIQSSVADAPSRRNVSTARRLILRSDTGTAAMIAPSRRVNGTLCGGDSALLCTTPNELKAGHDSGGIIAANAPFARA